MMMMMIIMWWGIKKRNGKCVTKKGNRMKREKRSVFVNLYFSENVLQ
jgi:hypothetical protein